MTITLPNESDSGMTVLAVSSSGDDLATLSVIFANSNWRLRYASGVSEALARIKLSSTPVIICERYLPDGDWHALMREIEKRTYPPRLIVSSRLANDQLWAEVLNLGAHDLLCTPFEAREVLYSVRSAWDAWRHDRKFSSKLGPARRASAVAGTI